MGGTAPADALPALAEARQLGFLGSGAIEDHLEHALGFARAWAAPPPAHALDLGSGGGLPGLVLALCWPSVRWVLLDANERRTAFLERWAARLALDRVAVRRARAEAAGRDPGLRGAFDLVTARGFGSPPVTAECAAPFLRVGGRLVVSEPPDEAVRWPLHGVAVVGLAPLRRVRTSATYVVLEQRSECPDRFPRRVGVPAKRPIF